MSYELKGFMMDPSGNSLNLKFKCILPSFEDCVDFLSRVHLDAYDRVTLLPTDYKEK